MARTGSGWSLTEIASKPGQWTFRTGTGQNLSAQWSNRSTWAFEAKDRRAAEAIARRLV